ncbi:hypothetical protein EVAR_19713_1 [Eumeta japonica]|uniref:Uncharacterized protein n=1 Tax=Eumeta variegata TaxID=151549 RepID=A0A4C1URS3_EUMVA|nr:hypothetical protein EVAR_19713_1 [Eumeta japonica]
MTRPPGRAALGHELPPPPDVYLLFSRHVVAAADSKPKRLRIYKVQVKSQGNIPIPPQLPPISLGEVSKRMSHETCLALNGVVNDSLRIRTRWTSKREI